MKADRTWSVLILVAGALFAACASHPQSDGAPEPISDPDAGAGQDHGDAGLVDAHVEEDAAKPTVPDEERWCTKQGTHALCADFDGQDVEEGWNVEVVEDGSSFEATASDRSAPSALGVTHAHSTSSDPRMSMVSFARLVEFQGTVPSSIRVALDLKVDALGSQSESAARIPVALLLKSAGNSTALVAGTQFEFTKSASRTVSFELDPGSNIPNVAFESADAFPIGRWVHVEVGLGISEESLTSTASFDQTVIEPVSLGHSDSVQDLEAVLLRLGSLASNDEDPFVVHFDNVVLDLE